MRTVDDTYGSLMVGLSAGITWFRNRPVWLVDGLAALTVLYADLTSIGMTPTDHYYSPQAVSAPLTTVLLLLDALPLALRRVAPLTVSLVTGGAVFAAGYLALPATGLGMALALFTVALHRSRRVAMLAAAVALAGVVVTLATFGQPEYTMSNVILLFAVMGLGDRTRVARQRAVALEERARELEHEREERSRLAVAAERARIARELHDITGHGVAVIAIQAAGARRVLRQDPDRADAAMKEIEDVARESLAEIRQAVTLLRDGTQDLAPQPGLGQLDALVARFRDAGLRVALETPADLSDAGPAVGLTVYRVVQEALTNALRHAGRTSARVRVALEPGEIHVTVSDGGPARGEPTSPPARGGGHGLAGLKERVSSHGGQLAVRGGAGGYLVDARIPLGARTAGTLA